MHAAVTSTSIGFKKLWFLLAALDFSPPSESGMHQMSQTDCDKIAQLSSDDMNPKVLQASGQQKKIHISVDTWYNTSGIRNSRRTGLPTAKQSTTVAMEKHINHNSFTSFKMYILFLFKAQTMNEEVLWVQVYAASNGCIHGQGHCENLSLSSTHVHIAPSL